MMVTFLLFFAFVINVGMLVNAKINLQNAADMAAYSGAAVQARQLTHISYLNYELRRQYKKFLFRYYVMGNLAQYAQPKSTGIGGARNWAPNGDPGDGTRGINGVTQGVSAHDQNPIIPFDVPVTCLPFNTNDNPCQLERLKAITQLQASVQDQINTVLAEQLKAIEQIRQNNCGAISTSNTSVMNYWLFNTDPEMKSLLSAGSALPPAEKAQLVAIQSVARGIGLVPKVFLINNRIDTLAKYVNEGPRTGINPASAAQMIGQGDAAASERTYDAFMSAYNSLGNHTFDTDDQIVMDEILPKGATGASDPAIGEPRLLKLDRVQVNFDVFVQQMGLSGCRQANLTAALNPPPAGTTAHDCFSCAVAMPQAINLNLARTKDPSVLTYYAVRLQAPAKLMFNPFGGDLTLRAYAAAQPFGSRIGPPQITEADFVRSGTDHAGNCDDIAADPSATVKCQKKIPNLAILGNPSGGGCEGTGRGKGWDKNDVIYGMFKQFARQGGQITNLTVLNASDFGRAYHAAMVPNPCEAGQYNIPVMDAPATGAGGLASLPDEYQHNFTVKNGTMAFWAPIKSGGNFDENELKQAMTKMFAGQSASINATLPGGTQQLVAALVKGLVNYVNVSLKAGGGEEGEGYNIARLTDPYNTRPDNPLAARVPIIFDPGINPSPMLGINSAKPQQIKTSFVPNHDSDVTKAGRIGYSVKLVPLRALAGQGSYKPTGSGNLGNPLPTGDMADEIQSIEH